MSINNFKKIIPEDNIKFAFMSKIFMSRVVILRNLFDYIKITKISKPFCLVSRSIAEKYENNFKLTPFSAGTIIKISGEPKIKQIKELVKKCASGKYDALIGIGGGSVLDTAKAIKNSIGLPLIVSPTTPSSGSETTPYALVVDEKINSKNLIRSFKIIPDVVVLDSVFLKTIPLKQMGYFLFDILGHCIEGLASKMSTVFSDAFAQKGIEIVSKVCLEKNKNFSKEMLSLIQTAGFLGGLTQGMASVGLAHSLAHYFGIKYNIPHAKAVYIFLPEVVRINSSGVHAYTKVDHSGLYDKNNYLSGEEYLFNLFKNVKKLFGLKEEKIKVGKKFNPEKAIAEIQKDFCAPTNPVKFQEKDFLEIFKNTLC